jgi:hypothetical protein
LFYAAFRLLHVCTYVFVVDFVYLHSSPYWYLCFHSIEVLSELPIDGVFVCIYIVCGLLVWVGGELVFL